MQRLHVKGRPRQMGEQFGEACRADAQALYRCRVENALAQARQYGGREVTERVLLEVAGACWTATRTYHPDGADELAGIARGAGLTEPQVVALNGLTDLRDVLAWSGELEAFGGCTAFVVQRDQTRDGRLWCGQTWDLATDNQPFVLSVRRSPSEGPETLCLTTSGCLSLIGQNAEGLCVGTTNIRTVDARVGVTYLSLIHCALGSRTLEAAVEAITSAPRAGAHFYYLADARGEARAVECSATRAQVWPLTQGAFVHANHSLAREHQALEGPQPKTSSLARQARLEALLRGGAGALDAPTLRGFLADEDGGPLAICRTDVDGVSTNGAVVMSPDSGEVFVCRGAPTDEGWVELRAAFGAPAARR